MMQPAKLTPWLNSRRLRAHALILGIALWSVYIWTISTPGLHDRNGNLKGTDFLHFYTLSWIAREHRGADLYNVQTQALLAGERVPAAKGIRYLPLYPPQVSVLLRPLSHFSYLSALVLWWLGSTLIYAVCCFSVWRVCPSLQVHGWTVLLLAIGFPAFLHLIAWGQTSAAALGCFTLLFFCLRAKCDFLAGLALGCLIFKPQLALAPLLLFLALGAWKLLAGAAVSAVSQLSVGVLYYGWDPLRAWFRTMWQIRSVLPWLEPRVYQTHSLRTFWSMLIPSETIPLMLYIVSAVLVLAMTIAIWRRSAPLSLRYSALLLATVLVAPHLTVYDLVILAPVFLLLPDWALAAGNSALNSKMGTALYLGYVLPLLGPFARWTHLQLSVIAMAAVLYLVWRATSEMKFNATDKIRTEAVTVA
jgi:alpha-1,2-mannosyltransferase